jgi:hypothetical protein
MRTHRGGDRGGDRGGADRERGRRSGSVRGRTRLLLSGSVLALAVTGISAGPAFAGPPTSVTGVSAALTTTAAGGEANWTVGFTVSASGAMPGTGSSVTVNLPTGSSPGPTGGDMVTDVTSGQTLTAANCVNSGTSVTCYLNYNNPVSGGDVLSFTLDAVTNPSTTGSDSFTVATSADTQPAGGSATITTMQPVTGVTATETSTEAGAQVAWTVGFTTSSTGVLVGTADSSITVTLPPGTTYGVGRTSLVTDMTTGNNLAYYCNFVSGTTVNCPIFLGQTVNTGDTVRVTLNVETNPTSVGSTGVAVSTSSDAAASSPVSITADRSVTGVSEALISTAASAQTSWTTDFTTTSTGGLDNAADSAITLTLPAGTTFGSFSFSLVTDTTTTATVSYGTCSVTGGTTVSCPLQAPVAAGHGLSVYLRGVTNPSTSGSGTLTVSTTSDVTPATATVSITPAKSVTGLAISPGSTEAGVESNWTIGFASSSTGAFPAFVGNVAVTLPTGTTFGSFSGGRLIDTTTSREVDNCSVTSGTTVTCLAEFSDTVNAGDRFSLVLNGVTNTLSTGPGSVSVATTSDTKKVTTSVTITGVVCKKVSGKLSKSITIKKCTPKSPTNKSATVPGASLTSGGTLTWKTSSQTTVLATSTTSPGQGGCKAGSTERDVTGSVSSGGTSTYTHTGDYVALRLCQTGSGAVSLVKGTTALF